MEGSVGPPPHPLHPLRTHLQRCAGPRRRRVYGVLCGLVRRVGVLDVLETRRHSQRRLEGSVVPRHQRPVVLVLALPEEALGGVAASTAQPRVDAEAHGIRLEEVQHEVAEAARAGRRP